ncbi:MAG: 3-dehydroquinate synthase [Velocimicrobium sp.]
MSKEILVHGPMQASNQVFPDKRVPIYKIYIERNFHKLADPLESLNLTERKVMIVTDSNVEMYHLSNVVSTVKKYAQHVFSFIMKAGESQKHLDTVADIYETMIQNNFERNDLLVALGGGVVGDITGFVAATYLRGIRFLQIPTSLLAMVDSSIGGKTGVDFRSFKNMVGAFHQPQAVYINLSVLTTLPDREFYSGFGEIIKHGLIRNNSYIHFLQNNAISAINRDMDVLEEIIYQSCLVKQAVVENDPTEKNERALLNFGHTIGHAIEKYMNFSLLHGECVAIGMAAALYLNYTKGILDETAFHESLALIEHYQLPICVDKKTVTLNANTSSELLSIIKHDKKMQAGQIRFILLKEPGCAYIDQTVTEEEMINAISFVMEGSN